MPARSWQEDFEGWAIRKGAPIEKDGPPGKPMKASTVNRMMARIKKVLTMTDPPYLVVASRNGPRVTYRTGRDADGNRVNIRRIRPEQIAEAFDRLFPFGVTMDVAQNHSKFVQAVKLLARWLTYELKEGARPCWSRRDMETLQSMLPTMFIRPRKLRVIEPEKFDRFLTWLKDVSPVHWSCLWAMRFIGLRYSGMRGAERRLRSKFPTNTFQVKGGRWTIWEKVYPREFEVPDHVRPFLDYWNERMDVLFPEAEWFFVKPNGNQWDERTTSLNKAMRRYWTRWCEETEEELLDEDLDLCHCHMCRHICATDLAARNVPPSVIQEYMGHQDLRTTQQYINLVASKQKALLDAAYADLNGVAP